MHLIYLCYLEIVEGHFKMTEKKCFSSYRFFYFSTTVTEKKLG